MSALLSHLGEVWRPFVVRLRLDSARWAAFAGRTGVLRITTACMQSYSWLPAVLAGSSRAHPEAEVAIVAEASGSPLEALREGSIDVALR